MFILFEEAAKLSNEAIKHSKKIYDYVQQQSYLNEPMANYNIPDGGFDVIIGNPPYVRQELLIKNDKEFLVENYKVGNGVADLYVYFYELTKLLKKNGRLGYITPNKWFKTKYGKNLREFIKKFEISLIIDFFELNIFHDASTEPQIIIIKNKKSDKSFNYFPVSNTKKFIDNSVVPVKINKSKLKSDSWIFTNSH